MSLIQGTWKLSTAPTTEPITALELGSHLRMSSDEIEDKTTDLEAVITAARQHAETFTRRAFVTQSWTLNLDAWPAGNVILLPRPPTVSVTSVKYYNTSGVQTTLVSGTTYQSDVASEPARVTVEPDATWPSLESGRLNPIEVIYVAGYGAASAVPEGIKRALYLICGAWWEYAEDVTDFQKHRIPLGADALLWQYRALEA